MRAHAEEQLMRLEAKMKSETDYRQKRNKEFLGLSLEELMAFHSKNVEGYVEPLWQLRGVVLSNKEAEKVARKFAQDIVDSSEDHMADLRKLHSLIKGKIQIAPCEEQAFLRSFPKELEKAWDRIGDWLG